MKRWPLAGRLSAVFAAVLLACCAVSAWLQVSANARHEQEVVQRLSLGLAAHIAGTAELMDAAGWRPQAVRGLFDKLMAVNPSVEVYLLDNEGRIVGDAAPAGHLKRDRVDLAPLRALQAGAPLPVLGDDPRDASVRKVFSAAPVRVGDRAAGYVYVILQGEDRAALAERASASGALRTALWTMGLVAVVGLAMGLVAFALVTRPLRELTRAVRGFDANGEAAAALAADADPGADEIGTLRAAFAQMGARIAAQWRELRERDRQRRELLTNISHDLRTPLTSLHGYLETLRLKDASLAPEERRRYLDTALAQSRKVGRLAQELFELARLESGLVHPEPETFALPDLVQDVLQKFELAAEARDQQLSAEVPAAVPAVRADLGMIERVLANLIDNAIRHNPPGTRIAVRVGSAPHAVRIEVSDTGPGIAAPVRAGLFTRAAARPAGAEGGGLGLVIVRRMLELHGSEIELLDDSAAHGTVFRFELAAA